MQVSCKSAEKNGRGTFVLYITKHGIFEVDWKICGGLQRPTFNLGKDETDQLKKWFLNKGGVE